MNAEGRSTTHAEIWLLGDDGAPQWLHRSRRDGSYASANDARVVFGLSGDAATAAVRVHWPDGRIEQFGELEPGRYHSLRRGEGTPAP